MTGAGTTVDERGICRSWRDRAPLDQASFRWRLGVRPLDLRDWIELGPDADAAIAAKPRLNAEHPSTVFAALDGVEAEAQQVADALLDHLRRRWPDRYADADLDPALHPLDAAARLVPEDLVLMVERDGRLVFGAGSVCFPNRWDLRSKIGLTARRRARAGGAAQRAAAGPDRPVLRPAHAGAQLLAPRLGRARHRRLVHADRRHGGAPSDRPRRPTELFLRVERETLRRFPASNAVLFTIRTYVTPIPSVADDPPRRRRLADALAGLPDPVQDVQGRRVVRARPDRPSAGRNCGDATRS